MGNTTIKTTILRLCRTPSTQRQIAARMERTAHGKTADSTGSRVQPRYYWIKEFWELVDDHKITTHYEGACIVPKYTAK